jgi:hypothetical protein
MAVQAKLRAASDAEIWEQVIAPIEWDTDAEEAPEVIREIKDRLVIMGQPAGVAPEKAEQVAEHLYATAFGTATRQKDRYLTRAGLLRLFHQRTHVSLPASVANTLFAAEERDEFAPPDFEHRLPPGQNYRNWGALSPSVLGSKDTTPRGLNMTAARLSPGAISEEQLKPLAAQRGFQESEAGNVPARLVELSDEAACDGIAHVRKDDRDRPRLPLDGNGHRRRTCQDANVAA